ncbi:helix-turn-helix domain-containing protein [Oenococcus oeni]|uniref:helix-turn-helix domain-containing protein n=1 Tax=Oenococcus oeni TaxID=1247 RepID=UPI001EF9E0D2|nr:helix-turn-helix domain-containing protein [Oenococcus oeni]
MKNLAELAGQLIDLQERDGFNTKTGHNQIEESMRFSIEHGYGDLAKKVRKLWEQIPDNKTSNLEIGPKKSVKFLSIYKKKEKAFRLVEKGMSYTTIANYLGISLSKIYQWKKEFERKLNS